MRLVLAASAGASALGVVAQATGLPPWLVLVGSILGGGGFVGRWAYLRLEQKFEQRLQTATATVQEATAEQTQVNTAKLVDEMGAQMLQRAHAELATMQTQLEAVKARLSETEARLAASQQDAAEKRLEFRVLLDEKERRMAIMRTEIERLHDEVAAYQQGQQTGKRRLDDEPEGP